MPTPTPTTLKLFRYGARKKSSPFTTIQLTCNKEGKIPLKSFLEQNRLENAYLWDGENVIQLLYDESGFWSLNLFGVGPYCLKVKETKTIDRSETFSTVMLQTVVQDFGLVEEDGNWTFNYNENVEFPQELQKTLEYMSKRHTFKAENSRRVLIELNILFAVEAVDPAASFLIMDRELGIDITREVHNDEDQPLQRIKYSGPLDFAIGYSKKGPPDTALLLITEVKSSIGFEKGFAKVLAQTASIVCIRRKLGRDHGECKSYFMHTDGERWVMGYVRPDPQDERVMNFGRSEEFTVFVKAPYVNVDKCVEIFKRIVGLVKLALNFTPRNSLIDISQIAEVDVDQAAISSELRALSMCDS